MRAITRSGDGGPDVLALGEVATPTAGPGEVLVRVAAAGVNRGDVLQRQGHYPPPPGASDLLGLEVSGRVEALGDGVDGWSVGDPCVALLAGGGYAEFVAVPAGQVVAPPAGMDLVTAAGVIEVAATVESNLAPLLRKGARLLVHGGAGGIGTFAIQYGKALGCTVIATAGSERNLAHCRELGADRALDYHGDWAAEVKAAGGADVILDIMGAKYLASNIDALAADGTLVVIGLQGGVKGELNLGALLAKRGTIRATALRSRPAGQKAEICARVAREVWPLFASGRVKPAPETRFPLADAARAHEQLESGGNVGKIVLVV